MSLKRKQKLQEREQRRLQSEKRKQQRCLKVLALLGLDEGFRRLPAKIQDVLVQTQLPAPQVVIGRGLEGLEVAPHLQRRVERELAGATLEVGDGQSRSVLVTELLTTVRGLVSLFGGLGEAVPAEHRAYMHEAHQITDNFFKTNTQGVLDALEMVMFRAFYGFSRLDTRLFSYRRREESPRGLAVTKLVLEAEVPEQIKVNVDGVSRPAFRVGGTVGPMWISWLSTIFDTAESERWYPVFCQRHALHRLHERLQNKEAWPLFEECLFRSLAEPRILERHGDDHLVEYRLGERRLGYLVARRVEDKVVIRTFLFLTMQGTPESRLLREKLRLHRADIEYQQLDRLDSFRRSDLATDPELATLFGECGRGPLLELANFPHRQNMISGAADDLRRFLGLRGRAGVRLDAK